MTKKKAEKAFWEIVGKRLGNAMQKKGITPYQFYCDLVEISCDLYIYMSGNKRYREEDFHVHLSKRLMKTYTRKRIAFMWDELSQHRKEFLKLLRVIEGKVKTEKGVYFYEEDVIEDGRMYVVYDTKGIGCTCFDSWSDAKSHLVDVLRSGEKLFTKPPKSFVLNEERDALLPLGQSLDFLKVQVV